MKEKKTQKPDQVVFDETTQKYNAALTPYATNLGAPAIVPDDVTSWKNTNINKVNHKFKSQFEDIKAQYEKMIEQFEYNNLIYSAKFSFEPILGKIYHLYKKENDDVWLSLISPEECNWNFAGSFRLNSEKMWERMDHKK